MSNNDPNNKKSGNALSEWTEQLHFRMDKLREDINASMEFSVAEAVQSTWSSVKSLPPTIKDTISQRNPVPVEQLDKVFPSDFSQRIRYVGSESPEFDLGDKAVNVLTLSAGGAKGAYGAGLISGWAQKGDMPEFDVIMGVSTGAIIALFSFIGWADKLGDFYTGYGTDDLVEKQVLQGITVGASLYDTTKLEHILRETIDDVAVKKLADEAEKGRVLLIGTTNLDRGLPVTWDLTAIARTYSPLARQLICDVMLASCAIPVAFPPVLFPVSDGDGNEYNEFHVDGAASLQMLIDVPIKNATIYAVANKTLTQRYHPASMDAFDIGNKSLSSALAHAIVGEMYRLYVQAQRNDNTFYATWIPETFTELPAGLFDVEYMRKLFALGHECALLGKVWHRHPPHFD